MHQWPEEYGGRGASPIESVIWNQEEGHYGKLSGTFIIGQGMCAPTLMAYASEEHKRRYLLSSQVVRKFGGQLFSEPHGGSDLAGLRTKAEKDGDEWIVNGQKIWTSGAHYSDYGILITRIPGCRETPWPHDVLPRYAVRRISIFDRSSRPRR